MTGTNNNTGFLSNLKDQYVSRKHNAWMAAGHHKPTLPLLEAYNMIANKGFEITKQDTDLVIEGYPRSANTFAYVAFNLSQDRSYKIAHHVHGAAQVSSAIHKKIPVLLLIRKPVDTILSLLLRYPFLKPQNAIRNYIRFYSKVQPLSHGYTLGEFKRVTQDFGSVIEKINAQFGTKFNRFETTPDTLKKCFQEIEKMDRSDTHLDIVSETSAARPSDERARLRKKMVEKLAFDKGHYLLAQANLIYRQIIQNNRNR